MAYQSNTESVLDFATANYQALRDPESFHHVIGTSFDDYYGQQPQRRMFVNGYERTQGYGGPEEGGWWFDIREPVSSIPVRSLDEAKAAIEQTDKLLSETYGDERPYYSAAGGADGIIVLETGFAQRTPEHTPHYE